MQKLDLSNLETRYDFQTKQAQLELYFLKEPFIVIDKKQILYTKLHEVTKETGGTPNCPNELFPIAKHPSGPKQKLVCCPEKQLFTFGEGIPWHTALPGTAKILG